MVNMLKQSRIFFSSDTRQITVNAGQCRQHLRQYSTASSLNGMLQAFLSVIDVVSSKGQIFLEAFGLTPQKLVEKRMAERDYVTFLLSSCLSVTANWSETNI